MMRKAFFILMVFSGCLPFLSYGQHDADIIRVMTFNIKYDKPSDSIYSWNGRRDKVFRVFRSEQPDIIGIQEGLHHQLEDIRSVFPEYGLAGVGREDGKTKGEYAAILFRTDRFTLVRTSSFWLSETPAVPGSISWNAACTRIVTWVELHDRNAQRSLFFFNTHFDHMSEQARVNSARLLLDSIQAIAGTIPVIVTGDFNSTMDDEACRTLAAQLDECRKTAKPRDAFHTSFIVFPADTSRNEVIDHVFLSRNTFDIQRYTINLYQEEGKYPSDHLPVQVEIKYK